ncbi:L-threonylcarbamoyladenylate synthase [Slackia heliotrinireducens]|jgi:L-threonylcarbamoyladenylate synthase|uniref:L-threonylcarbamoyladenylate synthase n=1 Tax=Slackia heliotrinireducens (strain ATCC 29202 / DSM 20476 / NCTC 11029 / RHS 1) TaxID=471855 RepID=C7N8D5_SLAHD|nr:L-threonylcarbamoyladenylate synthase [Slackia heliotrinireducens]ACV23170.1 Sua5/YciO/YrdC/YwlC family protein [Slackia heliotrinireducens DSM 20476]VEH02236.1 t(6)A37 threonylcarbamoyladenosine biosynthesis protein RimN [Slackia heliotrinireducens]
MAEALETSSFDDALAALNVGRPIIFPTDTVYGIGLAVGLAQTPQAIYDIKERDAGKAIPWLVGQHSSLLLYGQDVPEFAQTMARVFWPGPLTLIVRAASTVPKAFCGPDGTIALRMPDDDTALELIRRCGFPLATSSANLQGHKPPRRFSEIDPAVLSRVSAALGDNVPRSGVSSTVADCTGDHPEIIRVGAITAADFAALL